MTKRALIVGCGIAGPVLGMFLRRIGMEVVICEARAAREADGEGAFLGVAPNGMNVLQELGVREAVEASAVPCHRFEFQNARGVRVGAIDRADDQARFGARLQMLRRADLCRKLTRAAVERGVDVRYERRLVAIDQRDGESVCARFADGSEEKADLLFGCDGIRSQVRQLVLPDSPAPSDSGLVDVAGFASCPGAPIEVGVNVMVFGRRAFFGAFKTPAGEVWWFHNGAERSPTRERLLELHAGDPSWIADVIRATPTLVGPFALHDILSLPRWHRGRVCLVGDAAHATTPSAGQGASMALEDAIVLAKALREHGEPERAFAAFERSRRARVEEVVRQSRRQGNNKVPGPFGAWMRDLVLPVFLRLGEKAQARTYAHRIAWEGALGGGS